MQVEYLATISLPDDGWDVNTLEKACWEAARRTGKELFLQALEQREEKVLVEAVGDKKGEVRRYLITRLGVITFSREKVKQEREGTCNYICPLDKAIGLQSHQETTLWVKKKACELATKYTYREAATLLIAHIGDEVSHRAIHHWVQKKGGKKRIKGGRLYLRMVRCLKVKVRRKRSWSLRWTPPCSTPRRRGERSSL